jgi:uncharacterized membrane-anchored protein YhcB (DUF1043 family)
MEFTGWSPSHLILVGIAVASFIGQLLIVLTKLKSVSEQLSGDIEKLSRNMEKQRQEFRDELKYVRDELARLNQNHIEHLSRHHS